MCSSSLLSFSSLSLSTQHPQERHRENEGFAYEILAPLIECLSRKSTGVSFSQKYSMKMTAKPRQTSMCVCVRAYALCVSVRLAGEWDFLRLSPWAGGIWWRRWRTLPGPLWRAIVPGSHGGVALSSEHSQGGDALNSAALRDGEQQQRLKCCWLACVVS